MLEAWRIVKARYARGAFTGEGAFQMGGRWNSRGVRVVYTSGTRSLAALENLVHLNPPVLFKYLSIRIRFREELVEKIGLSALPKGWRDEPPSCSSQAVGDLWVKEARSAVLRLPSVIIPGEPTFLLNPAHRDFHKIVMGAAEPFTFDPRLLG